MTNTSPPNKIVPMFLILIEGLSLQRWVTVKSISTLLKKIVTTADLNRLTIRVMRMFVFLLCFSGITILCLAVRKFSYTSRM